MGILELLNNHISVSEVVKLMLHAGKSRLEGMLRFEFYERLSFFVRADILDTKLTALQKKEKEIDVVYIGHSLAPARLIIASYFVDSMIQFSPAFSKTKTFNVRYLTDVGHAQIFIKCRIRYVEFAPLVHIPKWIYTSTLWCFVGHILQL